MKKTVPALILACLLALSCVSAPAETAVEPTGVDLGDFSLLIDPDMPCQLNEKAENAVWFTLYPAYKAAGDSATNFNVVWSQEYNDLSSWKDSDAPDYISDVKTKTEEQYAALGAELIDFEIPAIQLTKLDGKDALASYMTSTIRYNGVEASLHQMNAIVSDPAFGTYTFTGTAQTQELLAAYVDPLFDAIRWN